MTLAFDKLTHNQPAQKTTMGLKSLDYIMSIEAPEDDNLKYKSTVGPSTDFF